jgi:hypothetical protein
MQVLNASVLSLKSHVFYLHTDAFVVQFAKRESQLDYIKSACKAFHYCQPVRESQRSHLQLLPVGSIGINDRWAVKQSASFRIAYPCAQSSQIGGDRE